MEKKEFLTNWIWTADTGKVEEPTVVYFRKKYVNAGQAKISANCRYKLYINGHFVQEGPEKGSRESAYVDTVNAADLQKWSHEGENIAAVEVLYYPEDGRKRNDSLYYSPYPCLYVEGEGLDGREGWKYAYGSHISLKKEPCDPAPICGVEMVREAVWLKGWKQPDYEDRDWLDAVPYDFFTSNQPVAPFLMEERMIPPMQHEDMRFAEVVCIRECGEQSRENAEFEEKQRWEKLLAKDEPLTIPPRSSRILELSAGELSCGYPLLSLAQGQGSIIKILYSECYGIPQPDQKTPKGMRPVPPIKGDRTDYKKGSLQGPEDIYEVSGYGTGEAAECYEPYLFRTFRYIRLSITTGEVPLMIQSYRYRSTGYPLEVLHHPVSKNETYNRIWDISLRTLKRCMHETYMDCPFYEQLAYAMDSRAEILFTYEVSEDDRLARACMEAFRKTQRSDGLLQASAPAEGINVIPGFSIFYILMVHDHMEYFHDRELVRRHLNCVDGILEYFGRHLTKKGLVGSVGGVLFQHKYWSFIDWCPEWDATIGVPTAATVGDGSITMESLLYLYGLKKAAELAAFAGRSGLSEEYLKRADMLAEAVKTHCVDDTGMILDGPGAALYSTHCQAWAILNDLVSREQGKKNLENTYRHKGIPQCSVSMSFYLMQAMDKLNILKEHDDIWDMWRTMLKNNMTTCVENFTDQRSDCHAWGALMLYALPRFYKEEMEKAECLTEQ